MTRTALITGAGKGIGEAIGLALAAQGMRVKIGCEGEGAADCLAEIGALIADKFGENQ